MCCVPDPSDGDKNTCSPYCDPLGKTQCCSRAFFQNGSTVTSRLRLAKNATVKVVEVKFNKGDFARPGTVIVTLLVKGVVISLPFRTEFPKTDDYDKFYITEIFVKPGDILKGGDPLYSYSRGVAGFKNVNFCCSECETCEHNQTIIAKCVPIPGCSPSNSINTQQSSTNTTIEYL